MILNIGQYLCLSTLVVLIVFSLLYALYGLLSKAHVPFGQSYRKLLDFFKRRVHELFSRGVIIGLFRYVIFFVYLLVLPVLVAYLLSGCFPRVEKISRAEDEGFVHTQYIAIGTFRLGDESVSIPDRKTLCIYNDTDRDFTLKQVEYVNMDGGYGSKGTMGEPEERVEAHSVHLTKRHPSFWFKAPDSFSSKTNYKESVLWVIE